MGGLIHVCITALAYLCKILYANGQASFHNFSIKTKINTVKKYLARDKRTMLLYDKSNSKYNTINMRIAQKHLKIEERHELPKMGPKTIGFVKKAYDFARQPPKLVPQYLDMDVYGTDCEDAHGLWTLVNSIWQVEQNAADTEMAAGSEAYQASLLFYNSVKAAAAQNIPGAKAVYQELRTRFPRGRRRTSEDAPETEATEAL